MTEVQEEKAEKGNDIVTIYKDGKSKDVTRKAFKVHYSDLGYTDEEPEQEEEIEYTLEYLQGLSDEELKEVTNPNLKLVLDAEGIEYAKNATKKELIALIPILDEE